MGNVSCVDMLVPTTIGKKREFGRRKKRGREKVPSVLMGRNAVTRVVHCKKEKYDIYIGRPSKWGNPFSIGKDGTREEVIQKYKEWISQQPELLADLPSLKGKVLGCWCKPQACHGDILAKLTEEISHAN
jgi:hypothetical protein